eukprot:790430-Prorocentrum_minimum.AAC.3
MCVDICLERGSVDKNALLHDIRTSLRRSLCASALNVAFNTFASSITADSIKAIPHYRTTILCETFYASRDGSRRDLVSYRRRVSGSTPTVARSADTSNPNRLFPEKHVVVPVERVSSRSVHTEGVFAARTTDSRAGDETFPLERTAHGARRSGQVRGGSARLLSHAGKQKAGKTRWGR